eukprot:11827615-Alexandrium_andersonii.AAC.1
MKQPRAATDGERRKSCCRREVFWRVWLRCLNVSSDWAGLRGLSSGASLASRRMKDRSWILAASCRSLS